VATTLSDDELQAWKALIRAHAALIEVLEQELIADREMPLAFYEVLVTLSETDGGRLRMSDLAARVLLSRSGMTRLVDRMVDAGMVGRDTCPADRRGSYAVLTPAGRAALKRAWPVHARGVIEHFARHLEPGEARQLANTLDRIATANGRPDGAASCGGG
jgi:DNA-binding MarR family transcriptional regulator